MNGDNVNWSSVNGDYVNWYVNGDNVNLNGWYVNVQWYSVFGNNGIWWNVNGDNDNMTNGEWW